MIRLAVLFLATLNVNAAIAASDKETTCSYQAQVVSAIRQARLDGVKERDVQATILAAGPEWPENYNAAIPLLTPWVYDKRRREIKNQDLAAGYKELCLIHQ